jgi:predicted RNase H-like HicB family nuclease
MRLRPSPAIDGPSREARGPATDLVPTAGSATTEPSAKPSRAERIELAIDSLPNYEVLKPIPVLIESLGDKVFVAEAPDLNLSTSGNSVGAAFLMLKEHIAATYEGYRSRKGVDPERARQLALMDQYIVKTKRHWF